MTLPPSLEVLHRCKDRLPDLKWDPKRVVLVVEDFPEADHLAVAGRAVDFMLEHRQVKDGPRTLRTFFERDRKDREKEEGSRERISAEARRLAAYSKPLNR